MLEATNIYKVSEFYQGNNFKKIAYKLLEHSLATTMTKGL